VKAFRALKARMHLMTEAEAAASIASFPRPLSGELQRQQKIQHFVVLFMENRAADHIFGCMLGDKPGYDGIPPSGHSIPYDPVEPSKGGVSVECGAADNVCTGSAGFNRYASHFAPNANNDTYPYGHQGDKYSFTHLLDVPAPAHAEQVEKKDTSRCSHYHCLNNSIKMFSAAQLPVKKAVSESYGVFNRYFSSVPASSYPNHLFAQSATSCGVPTNLNYNQCGGNTLRYPQMTIYDSLKVDGYDFAIYMNSTCGLPHEDKSPVIPCNYSELDSHADAGSFANGIDPDLFMSGVGRHKDHFFSQYTFYARAANGTLPEVSWLMPPSEAW